MSAVVKTVEREFAEALQRRMAVLPQPELDTRHYFAGGVYCREMRIKAGTVIVGKVHKHEHFFMVTQGTMRVLSDGIRDITGPELIVGAAGSKRVLLALTDCIGMNIHRVDSTDVEEIERELLEEDESATYDAKNVLKEVSLICG